MLDPEFFEEGRPCSVNRDVHTRIVVDYMPVTYQKLTIIDAFPEIPIKMDFSDRGQNDPYMWITYPKPSTGHTSWIYWIEFPGPAVESDLPPLYH